MKNDNPPIVAGLKTYFSRICQHFKLPETVKFSQSTFSDKDKNKISQTVALLML